MALQHLRSSTAHKRPIPTAMSAGQIAINTNEGSPGLFFKDSNGDLVKVGPVHIGTSAPNSSPNSLAATALVTGTVYQILTVGNSDFTLVGASANTVGTVFTATGTTTGTGTVSGQQGNEKGEQWLDTTGGTYVLKIYDGTAWRSESGTFVDVAGDTMTGNLVMNNANIVFEGATADNFETTLTVADPTADRSIVLPNVSGNIVTTGDTGTVTSAMIADGAIVNADVNASAAIAGTKISPDFGSQNLTTTGDVGIGTTPAVNLHVKSASSTGRIRIEGGGSSSAQLQFIAGGQTNPYVITQDTSRNLIFFDNATERLRIDSSGNATFKNSNYVSFNNNGYIRTDSTGYLRLQMGSNGTMFTNASNSEVARIDTSGRLLVGLSSSSANAAALFAGNPSGNYTPLYLAAKTTSIGTNDNFANISFTDSGHSVAAQIAAGRDGGTWTSGSSQPTKLTFHTTADGASSPTERLRIDSSGNLIAYGTVQTDGAFVSQGANAAGYLFQGNNNGSEVLFLKDDGAATFAAGNVNINKVTNGANLNVRNDASSATEVIEVYKGGFTSAHRTASIKNDGKIDSTELALYKQTSTGTDNIFRVFSNVGGTTALKADIKADGSATFGVNTSTYQTGVNISHSSNLSALTVYSANSSSHRSFVIFDNAQSGDARYRASIYANGSATFAGNVGIGSSGPRSKLEVSDGTSNTAGEAVNEVYFVGATTGNSEGILTIQSNNAMASDKGGSIAFGGRAVSSSAAGANWAFINGYKENGTSANYGGYLSFATRPNSGAISEAMRIDSSQNVGIGVSSLNSSSRLTLLESAGNAQTLEIKGANSGGGGSQPGIKFTAFNGDNIGGIYGDTNSDVVRIQTGGTDRLVVDNTGMSTFTASNAAGDVSAVKIIQTNANGYALWIGDGTATSNRKASILPNGAATLAGGNFIISSGGSILSDNGGNPSGAAKVNINSNGAATFAGNVSTGELNTISGSTTTGSKAAIFFSPSTTGSFSTGSAIKAERLSPDGSDLQFYTCTALGSTPTERVRIASNGRFSAFGTSISHVLRVSQTSSADTAFVVNNNATSTLDGAAKFVIRADGDAENTNNSYGALSDAKLKENIIDAASQWNDIKNIRVRNYNFIEGDTHKQLGVVAQEIETVSPGLVKERKDIDAEGNTLSTTTKSVNYSVLYMKAVKALQEAMERIETLETKVAALEAG